MTAVLSPLKCNSTQAVLSGLCITQHTDFPCKSKECLCCVNYKINSTDGFHMPLSLMCPFLHWWKHLSVPALLYLLLPSCTLRINVEDLSFQHKGKLNSLLPHFPHPFSFLSRTENSTSLMFSLKEVKRKAGKSLCKDTPAGFLLIALDGGNGFGLAARSLWLQRCFSGFQNGYFVHLSLENGKLEMLDLNWI